MKRKVLLHVGSFGREPEVFLYRHASGLRRYECHVVASEYRNRDQFPHPLVHLLDAESPLGRILLRFACGCLTLKRPGRFQVRNWRLRQVIQRSRPDVGHIHFLWNAIYFARTFVECGVPLIVTGHGSDVNRARVDKDYQEEVNAVFHAASRIVAVSAFIAEKLEEIGCPPQKMSHIYLGGPIPVGVADVSKQDGLIKVICVGALRQAKGHEYLIKAFAKALKKDSRLHLRLVGDGDERRNLEKLIKQLELNGFVNLTGFLPPERVGELLEESHIYAQHSIVEREYSSLGGLKSLSEEGLGISLVEAAAYALPIVATRTGGIPEICRDGENGYLVEQRDVDSMAERIIELAQNTELRARMGANGRALVGREFDLNTQIDKLEDLYDEVLVAGGN